MKYRKKPVIIDAIQLLNNNQSEINNFTKPNFFQFKKQGNKISLLIPTLEGEHLALEGDYIVKGIKGEFYPCKPDIFELTYERVL